MGSLAREMLNILRGLAPSEKPINFSNATILGFKDLTYFEIHDAYFSLDGRTILASERLFNDDNLLEFIVTTTDGWAIVNENYYEIFRQRYTGDEISCYFSVLETKNGNLLEVNVSTFTQTGVECCYWVPQPEGEPVCYYECPTGEYNHKIEIYALPGYSATNLRSTTAIQQLNNPFPNPAKTYIQLPYTLPEGVKEGTIRVFNAQGQLIKTFRLDGASKYVRLDTSRLPSGNYLYTIDTHGQKGESKQFIVNK